jgi:hypothetical protein
VTHSEKLPSEVVAFLRGQGASRIAADGPVVHFMHGVAGITKPAFVSFMRTPCLEFTFTVCRMTLREQKEFVMREDGSDFFGCLSLSEARLFLVYRQAVVPAPAHPELDALFGKAGEEITYLRGYVDALKNGAARRPESVLYLSVPQGHA